MHRVTRASVPPQRTLLLPQLHFVGIFVLIVDLSQLVRRLVIHALVKEEVWLIDLGEPCQRSLGCLSKGAGLVFALGLVGSRQCCPLMLYVAI